MNVVSVVAGGWSVHGVDHRDIPGTIIAVNDASYYLKRRADVTVSMDRLWTEYRYQYLRSNVLQSYLLETSLKNIEVKSSDANWLKVFRNNNKTVMFSHDVDQLNGTNSGTVALNLAFQLRPTMLFLFGFDMRSGPADQAHWYPPYPWAPKGATKPGKFAAWAREFEVIREQFELIGTEVYNVSDRTLIKAFPTVLPRNLYQFSKSRMR